MNPRGVTFGNEYEQLAERGGGPYSLGHQRMYTAPISLITSPVTPTAMELRKVDVLDVGCGIGYGYMMLKAAGILNQYRGVEPDPECVRYMKEQHPEAEVIEKFWLDVPEDQLFIADFTFCIEVVEHVPKEDLSSFLLRLRKFTRRNLFLSTPIKENSDHGLFTKDEWSHHIGRAAFDVAVVDWQWTTFFLCESV